MTYISNRRCKKKARESQARKRGGRSVADGHPLPLLDAPTTVSPTLANHPPPSPPPHPKPHQPPPTPQPYNPPRPPPRSSNDRKRVCYQLPPPRSTQKYTSNLKTKEEDHEKEKNEKDAQLRRPIKPERVNKVQGRESTTTQHTTLYSPKKPPVTEEKAGKVRFNLRNTERAARKIQQHCSA